MGGTVMVLTVTDRHLSEEYAAWYHRQGVPLVLTMFGRGTATTEILDYLGLEATEKAVLICLSPRSADLARRAGRELWLEAPGRGILVTVPVDGIGGAAARDCLIQPQGETAEEGTRLEQGSGAPAYELLVVITNQGCTDQVMDAARGAGAAGGTSLHAKGTGTELARRFLGVSIAAEKELVLIVTKEETRKPIMKAIMEQAGSRSKAQSLVFSLPVDEIAGLRELQ